MTHRYGDPMQTRQNITDEALLRQEADEARLRYVDRPDGRVELEAENRRLSLLVESLRAELAEWRKMTEVTQTDS